MKRILVPCDFSDTAIQAFRFALDIANQSKGEIILLNVIELPVMYDTMLMPSLYFEEDALKSLKTEVEKNYNKLMSKWTKNGRSISFITEYGPVALTISRFAEKMKASLIVMGTKGATGLKDYFDVN